MQLSQKRMAEICGQLVELRLKEMGLGNIKCELGNIAKRLDGVSTGELEALVISMLPKIVMDTLSVESVSIKMH